MSHKRNEALRHVQHSMHHVIAAGEGSDRAPDSCKLCPYYRPDFKFRTCLYAHCPYKKQVNVFRSTPEKWDILYGGYEIISGHRRQHAAQLAGLDALPVIVRNMDDDAAVLLMVDSNLQRENILPSERAFAYKMKLEALKNQGARSDLTSRQVGEKLWSVSQVSADANESERQVHRFIRLTNLIPELLDMVDEKKISFNPAVELSYLDESQQRDFLEAMDGTQNAPSVSQAQQLKKMAQCGEFTYEKAFDILGQEKKSEQDTVTIKNDILRKYFPRSYTPRQMEEKIIQLLDAWQKKQQRRNER